MLMQGISSPRYLTCDQSRGKKPRFVMEGVRENRKTSVERLERQTHTMGRAGARGGARDGRMHALA